MRTALVLTFLSRPQALVLAWARLGSEDGSRPHFPQPSSGSRPSLAGLGGEDALVLTFLGSLGQVRTEASSSVLSFLSFPEAVPYVRCLALCYGHRHPG